MKDVYKFIRLVPAFIVILCTLMFFIVGPQFLQELKLAMNDVALDLSRGRQWLQPVWTELKNHHATHISSSDRFSKASKNPTEMPGLLGTAEPLKYLNMSPAFSSEQTCTIFSENSQLALSLTTISSVSTLLGRSCPVKWIGLNRSEVQHPRTGSNAKTNLTKPFCPSSLIQESWGRKNESLLLGRSSPSRFFFVGSLWTFYDSKGQ